jgi:hypothetical protein
MYSAKQHGGAIWQHKYVLSTNMPKTARNYRSQWQQTQSPFGLIGGSISGRMLLLGYGKCYEASIAY